jgi:mRNA-degrading endonuclease RelE of RelBE toxin-antitoxin system
MRVDYHPRFFKESKRLPKEIRLWIESQIIAMRAAPDVTAASAGAFKVKGAPDVWVKKFRRKPHGDYRLVFRLTEDAAVVLSCDSRERGYKTALLRAGGELR